MALSALTQIKSYKQRQGEGASSSFVKLTFHFWNISRLQAASVGLKFCDNVSLLPIRLVVSPAAGNQSSTVTLPLVSIAPPSNLRAKLSSCPTGIIAPKAGETKVNSVLLGGILAVCNVKLAGSLPLKLIVQPGIGRIEQ